MPASLPMPTPRLSGPKRGNPWRERIGLYLLGVSIGLVLAGTILMARYNSLRREEAERQRQSQPAAPPAPPRPDGNPAPDPAAQLHPGPEPSPPGNN